MADATRLAIFWLNGNRRETAAVIRHDGLLAIAVALELIRLKDRAHAESLLAYLQETS